KQPPIRQATRQLTPTPAYFRPPNDPGGFRTHDLRIKSPLLYQLSYRVAKQLQDKRELRWRQAASINPPHQLARRHKYALSAKRPRLRLSSALRVPVDGKNSSIQ